VNEAGVIRAEGLTRSFENLCAVHPLWVTIGSGGVTGLLGPNGSGKSTFLRMLTGLVRPHGGQALVDGVALKGDGTDIRKRVTYMPGEVRPYGELSGLEHLRWLVRGRTDEAWPRAHEIASQLGLPLERRVRGYSHGMKRQLFFAAAMGPRVRVRIFDEPTEGLDPTRRREVLELLLAEARDQGTTILLSSHHLGEVDRACDRTLFLRRGKLLDETATGNIHRRAQRALRVQFPPETPNEHLEQAASAVRDLEGIEVAEGSNHGRLTLFVEEGSDPKQVLASLFTSPNLPEPTSFVYGELSLHELYRELYGSEGV
jgi:ABC-2 type transport system ATP-binding protein